MPTEVTHFGIHFGEGNVAFLEQEKARRYRGSPGEPTGSNALGLRVRSDFRVVPRKANARCNHLFPLAALTTDIEHWETFLALVRSDHLTRAMLPIPRSVHGGYWLNQSELPAHDVGVYLAMLSQMSSPVSSIVHPIWAMEVRNIADELTLTNVQPLVLTGCTATHTNQLNKLNEVVPHVPRTLLVTGANDVIVPPNFTRISTTITEHPLEDLLVLPWSSLGATVVRRYMRGEWKI